MKISRSLFGWSELACDFKLSVIYDSGGKLVVSCSLTTIFLGRVNFTRTRFTNVSFVLPTLEESSRCLPHRMYDPYTALFWL